MNTTVGESKVINAVVPALLLIEKTAIEPSGIACFKPIFIILINPPIKACGRLLFFVADNVEEVNE
jgi:hypothetical protein